MSLQERNAVALEEEKDLVKVGRAVERVVEHVEVHLRRQKLHRQLPEWEAEKVTERESSGMSVVVVVRGRRLPICQQ